MRRGVGRRHTALHLALGDAAAADRIGGTCPLLRVWTEVQTAQTAPGSAAGAAGAAAALLAAAAGTAAGAAAGRPGARAHHLVDGVRRAAGEHAATAKGGGDRVRPRRQ